MIDEKIQKKENFGKEEYTHPSFGSVSLSKITCRNEALFGSSIKHNNMISLKIKENTLTREHAQDNYLGENRPIIEIWLSPLQFSEMLTTMNYAEGVPCTIASRVDVSNGQRIKYPEEMAHKDKLQEYLDEAADSTKDLQRFLKPHLQKVADNLDTNKSLGKNAQKELLHSLQTVMTHLSSTPKFYMEQFTEYMEKTVIEAKASMDSQVDTLIRQTGIETLKANKLLSDKE